MKMRLLVFSVLENDFEAFVNKKSKSKDLLFMFQ